ncbi:unnamed protein product, partial [Closterium sp. Naga37s-1]
MAALHMVSHVSGGLSSVAPTASASSGFDEMAAGRTRKYYMVGGKGGVGKTSVARIHVIRVRRDGGGEDVQVSHGGGEGRRGEDELRASTSSGFDEMVAGRTRKYYMVGGKGGVGKTSVSAALAVKFANEGHRPLVVSTDPAHSLSDSFAQDVSGGTPVAVEGTDLPLFAMEIDPEQAREEFRTATGKDGGKGVKDFMDSVGLGGWVDQGVKGFMDSVGLGGWVDQGVKDFMDSMGLGGWLDQSTQKTSPPTPSFSLFRSLPRLPGSQLSELKLGELLDTPPPGLDEAVAIAKVGGAAHLMQATENSNFTRITCCTPLSPFPHLSLTLTSSHLLSPPLNSSHLLSPSLTFSQLLSPPLTSSHLLSTPLTSSHLLSPSLNSSHLLSPPLTSSHLFSPLLTSSHHSPPLSLPPGGAVHAITRGHTLRLLSLLDFLDASIGKILTLKNKISSATSAVKSLFGQEDGKPDTAVEKLEQLKERMVMVREIFRDQKATEFIIVTIPTIMAINKSARLLKSLEVEGVPVKRLIANQILPKSNSDCKFCNIKRKDQQRALDGVEADKE